MPMSQPVMQVRCRVLCRLISMVNYLEHLNYYAALLRDDKRHTLSAIHTLTTACIFIFDLVQALPGIDISFLPTCVSKVFGVLHAGMRMLA